MHIRVKNTHKPKDYEKVSPNFIYNRFDLFSETGEFEAAKIITGKESKIVEYQIVGNQANLGLWLVPISRDEIHHLLYHIHCKYPQVSHVSYKNGYTNYGIGKTVTQNHFKIILPETVAEMEGRISPKSRSEMRRRNRRAEEVYGKMQILEYDGQRIPPKIVEAFFQFKKQTWRRSYNMTSDEYLDRYHVSHCYVIMFGNTIGAINFLCEQCPVVNGENHCYNPELKDYSLGKFCFTHVLMRITEKRHTAIFLSGGNFEYKTHYGSIEETVFDCNIPLSEIDFTDIETQRKTINQLKTLLKTYLPPKMIDFLRNAKRFLFR